MKKMARFVSVAIIIPITCIVTILLLFSACTPYKTYACPDDSVVDDIAKCQPPKPPVVVAPPVAPPEIEPVHPLLPNTTGPEIPEPLPVEVQNLFAKAKDRVNSYSYSYQGPPHEKKYYKVYRKGDLLRVDLPKGDFLINQLNFDTVYISLAQNRARAFCERDRNLCKGTDSIVVTAKDFIFKTPFDWMDELSGGTIKTTETVDGRSALRWSKENMTVWIDTYSGLPILIYIGEDTKSLADKLVKYEYNGVSINSVADTDLMHQTIA
jgi:hypothetical protein